jgi:hypothetical protein
MGEGAPMLGEARLLDHEEPSGDAPDLFELYHNAPSHRVTLCLFVNLQRGAQIFAGRPGARRLLNARLC